MSRDVSSLRDSRHKPSLPGTDVPGYRLFRPCGTALLRPVNDTAIAAFLSLHEKPEMGSSGAKKPVACDI
jgi:hypothetical protein